MRESIPPEQLSQAITAAFPPPFPIKAFSGAAAAFFSCQVSLPSTHIIAQRTQNQTMTGKGSLYLCHLGLNDLQRSSRVLLGKSLLLASVSTGKPLIYCDDALGSWSKPPEIKFYIIYLNSPPLSQLVLDGLESTNDQLRGAEQVRAPPQLPSEPVKDIVKTRACFALSFH